MKKKTLLSLAMGAAFPWLAGSAMAQATDTHAVRTARSASSRSASSPSPAEQPTSLPTQIPTTIEACPTREEIETRINATDSEDALKYLPSLLVLKRYIGDYNHAILSTRASGTGNRARSAVYADGILLSSHPGNGIANGTNYAPRWGLVTPEEIERVDVMYGPFSAAYPGNWQARWSTMSPGCQTSRSARQGGLFVPAFRSLQHAPDFQQLADQRLDREQERRLVVVDRCLPHRQPGPAAHVHYRDVGLGNPWAEWHAGFRLRAGAEHHQHALVHPGHRHAVPHSAGSRQAQAGLRLLADRPGNLHAGLVAEQFRRTP